MNPQTAPQDSAPTRAVIIVLAAIFAAYAALAAYGVIFGRTWLDEVTYIVKSWWYVTGEVRPYSDADATWYMPLYFYQLGWAQKIFGAGHITGRALSSVIGALSGVLVFLICRRLKVSAAVAVGAVALYLLTPTTAYYFATATPIATVAFLILLAVYVILRSAGTPRPEISAALGVLFALLYFYRQNAVLAVAGLAPLYLYLIGSRRLMNGAVMALAGAVVAAVILAIFPEKLALYAIRLPLLTPLLNQLGLLPDTLRIIQDATETPYSLNIDPGRLSWRDAVNGFVLPFLGTIILALAVFAVRRSERFLMLVPAFFFFLAVTHYLGSAGYCPVCILTYTSYFVGIGAVAAALAVDVLWRKGKIYTGAMVGAGALLLNIFGTVFEVPNAAGQPSPYRYFPLPLVTRVNGLSDLTMSDRLTRIIAMTTPDKAKVLVLDDQPALAYAAVRMGHTVPVQGFNLRQSYRRLRPGLSEAEQTEVTRVLEAESLWTDSTLLSWLDDESISVVMLQENAVQLSPEARRRLDERYRFNANVVVLGRDIRVYVRKSEAQPIAAPSASPAGAALPEIPGNPSAK